MVPLGANGYQSSGNHPPSSASLVDGKKPSFAYDVDIFSQLHQYLVDKNHHGLALVARQKGVPPFLRFKIWPILLKYHPFVLNPFIQPDNEVIHKKRDSDSELDHDVSRDDVLRGKIRKDLRRYIHRLKFSSSSSSSTSNSQSTTPPNENIHGVGSAHFGELSHSELQVFETLEKAVFKFVTKWGKIIKYDLALTWVALGLAEWVPPIPKSSLVLVGRDSNNGSTLVKDVFEDYSHYIESVEFGPELQKLVDEDSMPFQDVYERLVLVILHTPEEGTRRRPSTGALDFKIDKSTLPVSGGTIEERVSFFIYLLRKLLPELSQYFSEEQILNKFGSNDDEWLIWWLKYGGLKVWSRVDRGRIWDTVLGWRVPNKKNERKNKYYYIEKMNISNKVLEKLGPDVFWTVDDEDSEVPRNSSTKSLTEALNECKLTDTEQMIPFGRIDPHIEIVFIALALLRSKENTLVELDQHEIRQYLLRLPSKSYNRSDKYKQYQEQKREEELGSSSPSDDERAHIVSNNNKVDFMENIIAEAGELWRKWLYLEMVDN